MNLCRGINCTFKMPGFQGGDFGGKTEFKEKTIQISLIGITNTLYEIILRGKSTSATCEIKLLHFANIDSQNAHCKYQIYRAFVFLMILAKITTHFTRRASLYAL